MVFAVVEWLQHWKPLRLFSFRVCSLCCNVFTWEEMEERLTANFQRALHVVQGETAEDG